MHVAAGTNDVVWVARLLQRGHDVNELKSGEIPLQHAARLGCLDTAMVLLENGADVHARNNSKNTVLHYACFRHPYDKLASVNKDSFDDADEYVQSVSSALENKRATLVLIIVAGGNVETGGDEGLTAVISSGLNAI